MSLLARVVGFLIMLGCWAAAFFFNGAPWWAALIAAALMAQLVSLEAKLPERAS